MKAQHAYGLIENVSKKIWSGENNFIVNLSDDLPLLVLEEQLCTPNSGFTITKVDNDHYIVNLEHKLSDEQALTELNKLTQAGMTLVSVNQCACKALHISKEGEVSVFSYDTMYSKSGLKFYISGSVNCVEEDIETLFNVQKINGFSF